MAESKVEKEETMDLEGKREDMHTSSNSHRQARAAGRKAWRHLIRSSGTLGTFLQNSTDQYMGQFSVFKDNMYVIMRACICV